MTTPRVITLPLAPLGDALFFNVQFSADGEHWTDYNTSTSPFPTPEDLPIALLDTYGNYCLDGVNAPTGNMALASGAAWHRTRLKAAGCASWSEPFHVRWPEIDDVVDWIASALRVVPAEVPAYVREPIPTKLAAAVDEVESPIGQAGAGGTGRLFTPTVTTRRYDGGGGALLEIDDVVPTAALAVTVNGVALADVSLLEPREWWEGHRSLARPNPVAYGLPGLFLPGYGNVVVSGTFGFAWAVPNDLWAAVAGEAARRAVIQGAVPLEGVGESLSMGSYSITTSSGISVWADSSTLALWQQGFSGAIKQFRRRHPEPYARRGW